MSDNSSARCENIASLRWVSLALLIPAVLLYLIRYTNLTPIQERSILEFQIQVATLIVSCTLLLLGLNGCKRCSKLFSRGRGFVVAFFVIYAMQLLPLFYEHFPKFSILRNSMFLRVTLIPFYALSASSLAYSILSPCAYYTRSNTKPTFTNVFCNFVLLLIIVFTILSSIGDAMFALDIQTKIALIDDLAWSTLLHRNAVYVALLTLASVAVFVAQHHIQTNRVDSSDHGDALGYF